MKSKDRDVVIAIVAEQLGVKVPSVTDSTDMVEELGADSLDLIEINMWCEEHFEVRIPDEFEKTTVQYLLDKIDSSRQCSSDA